ncbi:MAG: zf-HC2 domain-containing protein [Pyrinomonadaceae bacterium]|nr:zf-HC2 domain-containing protein [Pyrinomonadaceae bacterium]
MKCSDLKSKISLYIDGILSDGESRSLDDHLSACPLCREHVNDERQLRRDLGKLGRPSIPPAVVGSIKFALREKVSEGRPSIFSTTVSDWIPMRLMPLGVGIATSLVIGVSFLSMMFAGARSAGEIISSDRGRDTRIMLAPGNSDGANDISPTEYARSRMSVAGESPSINPNGAIVALTRSLVGSRMREDEVVVVANVLSNGLARVTEVVGGDTDPKTVADLERALQTDGSNTPFVPAVMDNRGENVRVVLKFKTVNVSTRTAPKR